MPPSIKHEALKTVLHKSIKSLGPAVPKVNHIRALLEMATTLRTLPWGVHYEKVQRGNISGDFVAVDGCYREYVLLFLHGGGYSIGSSRTHRSLVGTLAKESNMRVFLPEYRKAPEFPFPAALNDAVDAYKLLLEEYTAENIVLVGDSAGGGLLLSLQHACKQRQLPLPKASVCFSPWVDLVDMTGTVVTNAEKDPLIDIRKMRIWAEMYSGKYDMTHSLVSPLYGNFEGFGPILIQTSRDEMLYDNARKLARKAELDTDITLQTWEGMMHWWHLFTGMVPEADEAVQKAAEFIHCLYNLK